jgi:hypothetical protein
MKPEHEQDLEGYIHRELRKLGERTAPPTLIPRVLRSIEAQSARGWHQQPWPEWPVPLQVFSMVIMLGAGLAAMAASLSLWDAVLLGDGTSTLEGVVELASVLGNAVAALANALLLLAGAFLQPWLIAGVLISLLMYLAVIGLGAFCVRLALHSSSIHEN